MANDAPFDPCRQWLGIDAVDLGDARLVLGVPPLESDPRVVSRAADARLNLLRSISPGPFEMARASLVKRVEEAREKVLAEIASAQRRAPAPAAGFSMPAPPSHRQTATPPASRGVGGLPPAVPPSVPPAVPPRVPGHIDAVGGFEPIAIRTTIYRKKTPVAGIVLTIVALSAAAGGLAYYTFNGKQGAVRRETARSARRGEPAGDAGQSRGSGEEGPGNESGGRPTRRDIARAAPSSDLAVSSSRPPANRRERIPPNRREPEGGPSALDAAVAAAAPPDAPSTGKPAARSMSRPAVRQGPGAESMAGMGAESSEPMPKPPAAAPAVDAPAPETAAESAKLTATLAEALAAMQAKEDDTVERLLTAAARQVTAGKPGSDAGRRISNWRHLATYYKGFMGFREQALAAVKSGDEYEVRSQKIAVVEADESVFKYRVAGETRTVDRDKIPGGIVLAIVMAWFDPNPANDLYVGAYHLGKPESDPKRAREHWLKAESGGADASALLPLLEDPVFAGATGDE